MSPWLRKRWRGSSSPAQLAEVVDLAVEDEPERAVLVRDRLVSRLAEVDDREPAVAERDRPVDVTALGVGPPVGERPRQPGCLVATVVSESAAAHAHRRGDPPGAAHARYASVRGPPTAAAPRATRGAWTAGAVVARSTVRRPAAPSLERSSRESSRSESSSTHCRGVARVQTVDARPVTIPAFTPTGETTGGMPRAMYCSALKPHLPRRPGIVGQRHQADVDRAQILHLRLCTPRHARDRRAPAARPARPRPATRIDRRLRSSSRGACRVAR